ncbi:MAG: S1C family serine protease [Gaiellaceae bacterium]
MPSNRIVAMVAAAAVVGGGAGAAIATLAEGGSSAKTSTLTNVAAGANVANSDLSVGQVAKSATKSVVEIDATSSGGDQAFPFGNSGGSSAEGTGFVYDTKGDIVTNQHVISGAGTVKVKFSDGSTYTASIVGSDPSTDLAVVHVNAPSSKLVPLVLADSSKVSVGDGVVAIGNPFGLDGTVTSGIVSATGREIASPNDTPIEGAIQTDAAINHGNSGGPLLNLHGEVVGITSQIQSEGGGNDGVGFAVPSNTVKSIAAQLISSGKAQHALLGVTPADTGNGVRIANVKSGSAADDAGLKAGDVITAVGSTQITSSAQIRAIIAGKQPGDAMTLTIRRDGSSKTVHVTLGARS